MNEQQINNRIDESSSHQTNNSNVSSNELKISNGNLQREVNSLSSDLASLRDLQASQNTQIQDLNSRLNDILLQVNRQSSTQSEPLIEKISVLNSNIESISRTQQTFFTKNQLRSILGTARASLQKKKKKKIRIRKKCLSALWWARQ